MAMPLAAAPYRASGLVLWQILLQKSFCEVGLKFSDP
jgi:hypothetical protein